MAALVWVRGHRTAIDSYNPMVMGQPPHNLGPLPAAVYAALIDSDTAYLGFGNDESRGPAGAGGVTNSGYMLQRLQWAFDSEALLQYEPLRLLKWPNYQGRLRQLIQGAYVAPPGTLFAETQAVIKHARQEGVTRVTDVVPGEIAVQCTALVLQMRQAGQIPSNLMWSILPTYTATRTT